LFYDTLDSKTVKLIIFENFSEKTFGIYFLDS
jgi:hypothetical protein